MGPTNKGSQFPDRQSFNAHVRSPGRSSPQSSLSGFPAARPNEGISPPAMFPAQPAPIRDSSDLPTANSIQHTAAEAELRRIVNSQTFARSPRLRHLLQYIVQQWGAGNSDKLDGYNLAIDVFKRDTSFESGLDPIVRVEMTRLRTLLAKYYAGEGCYDTLRIDIPKGNYVPVFTETYVRDDDTGPTHHEDWLGTVVVLPLHLQGASIDLHTPHAAGVYDQMLYLLTKVPGMRVVSRVSATHLPRYLDARLIGEQVGARFIVEGSVLCLQHACLIVIHLSDAANGYNVWSERYATDSEKLSETINRIAEELASHIQGSL